jgi:hypothetical protein
MRHNIFLLQALGYDSYQDFLNTLTIKFTPIVLVLIGIMGTIGVFIETWMWEDAHAIYFMWLLLLIDLCSGVAKAHFIHKRFTSRRLPRWGGIVLTYNLFLWIAHNMSLYAGKAFAFLPSALYGLFVLTLVKSIWENLVELKLIQGEIVDKVNSILKKPKKDEKNPF